MRRGFHGLFMMGRRDEKTKRKLILKIIGGPKINVKKNVPGRIRASVFTELREPQRDDLTTNRQGPEAYRFVEIIGRLQNSDKRY